eukprot:TRINITY_DN22186_c0_g1_i1.p1 TRINITY_DN22186_c0_g1~~TRINITY_DN22186_c0_g1_i1.p1  ORF type:complete len:328 (-),score=42.08 TRINITY_DN22186_c0_g1_i1:322-1305(-)
MRAIFLKPIQSHATIFHIISQPLRLREVWDSNLDEEMKLMQEVVDKYPFIAMDTEFPGIVAKALGNFKGTEYQYQQLRQNVNLLKLIQLGLTFTDKDGNLPTIEGELCIWQINFREFKLSQDMFAPESIQLLKEAGIQFEKLEKFGVDMKKFGEQLMTSGIVLNEEIKWVTFHSGYDFGYLLKVLTCKDLPPTEMDFFKMLGFYFPHFYDMKYLMKFCENMHGGLQRLSENLGVERIGPQHQAGSDSLLTSQTFNKLVDRFMGGMEGAYKYRGVLYGLGFDLGNDVHWNGQMTSDQINNDQAGSINNNESIDVQQIRRRMIQTTVQV